MKKLKSINLIYLRFFYFIIIYFIYLRKLVFSLILETEDLTTKIFSCEDIQND